MVTMKPLTVKNSKELLFRHVLETIGLPDLSMTSKISNQKEKKTFLLMLMEKVSK